MDFRSRGTSLQVRQNSSVITRLQHTEWVVILFASFHLSFRLNNLILRRLHLAIEDAQIHDTTPSFMSHWLNDSARRRLHLIIEYAVQIHSAIDDSGCAGEAGYKESCAKEYRITHMTPPPHRIPPSAYTRRHHHQDRRSVYRPFLRLFCSFLHNYFAYFSLAHLCADSLVAHRQVNERQLSGISTMNDSLDGLHKEWCTRVMSTNQKIKKRQSRVRCGGLEGLY